MALYHPYVANTVLATLRCMNLCLINLNIFAYVVEFIFFFFSSRRRHTRYWRDWSSDVCSSDLLLEFDPDDGVADGLTVDDEGCLWTALWGGGQVRRWSPEGELLAVVEVPGVAQTSSCAFTGPARDLLVVSTSAEGLDDAGRAAQPDAGRLFTARPGGTGPPAPPYRGPLEELRRRPEERRVGEEGRSRRSADHSTKN